LYTVPGGCLVAFDTFHSNAIIELLLLLVCEMTE
jgi:hypothetical protein